MPLIVHAITPKQFKIGDEVRSRCGRSATVDTLGVGAASLIAVSGSQLYGTTHRDAVTCKKCVNLITVGTIHVKQSRSAVAQKRAMAHASVAAARGAGTHRNPVGRPKGGRLRPANPD